MNKPDTITYEGIHALPVFILVVVSALLTYTGYIFISSLITPTGTHPTASIVFYGLLFVVISLLWANTLQLFIKKVPSLTLTDNGLHYEKLSQQINVDTIPWQELGEATIRSYPRSQIISISFADDNSSYIHQLPKTHKRVFGNNIVVFCVTLDGTGKDICAKINQFIEGSRSQTKQATVEHGDTEGALNV